MVVCHAVTPPLLPKVCKVFETGGLSLDFWLGPNVEIKRERSAFWAGPFDFATGSSVADWGKLLRQFFGVYFRR